MILLRAEGDGAVFYLRACVWVALQYVSVHRY
jgi:hypothetical protein